MTPAQSAWGLRFWLITVAAVASILVTASLGRWQLSRAAQKQTLQSLLDQRAALPPLDNRALRGQTLAGDGTAQDLTHRAVVLQGRWVPEHTVYLDNRQMQGRPGFFVATPLQLEGGDGVVLVQRGWVPRDQADRTKLPTVATPGGPVSLVGRIAPPPSRLFDLGEEGSSPIRQNVDLDALARETRLTLRPLSLQQLDGTAAAGDGLQREWAAPAADVHKHYGYAFQWFALCALTIGLYVWFQLLRPRRRAR